jgi:photosystem II stability/assembly factor-like uncharacterized protein
MASTGTTRYLRIPIPGAALVRVLTILCASAVGAHAQDWVRVPLGTTADIHAIGNGYLPWRWVAGAHGFAARSNDSRTSWTTIPSGTEADFFSVTEPGGGEVWFGGGRGTVRLRIYQFWFSRNLPDPDDYRVFTRRGAQAVAVGPRGKLYQSTNAGNTWTLRPTGTTADLNNGHGSPSGPGWAIGDAGTILRTADGVDWMPVPSGTTADLYGIAELDYTNVYVVGAGGTILKSTDGGRTWSAKPSGTTRTLRAVSISKVSPSHLIAVGSAGTVLRSTDAGETWCRLAATNADLYAAEAVSDTEFFVGGAGGLLLRTTNGGGRCRDASEIAATTPDRGAIRLHGPFAEPSAGGVVGTLSVPASRVFRIEVLDAAGGPMHVRPALLAAESATTFAIDTRGWTPGHYQLRVTAGSEEITRRFVVTSAPFEAFVAMLRGRSSAR